MRSAAGNGCLTWLSVHLRHAWKKTKQQNTVILLCHEQKSLRKELTLAKLSWRRNMKEHLASLRFDQLKTSVRLSSNILWKS